jgi:DNA polymerase III delta subunit
MAFYADSGKSLENLFTEFRIWDGKRKHAVKAVLHRYKTHDLHALLKTAVEIDRKIKSSDRVIVWDMLQAFLLSLAGKQIIDHKLDHDFKIH